MEKQAEKLLMELVGDILLNNPHLELTVWTVIPSARDSLGGHIGCVIHEENAVPTDADECSFGNTLYEALEKEVRNFIAVKGGL